MKYFFSIVMCLFILACQPTDQAPVTVEKIVEKIAPLKLDTAGYETFTYPEGDTIYLMKKYFMVHLKPGPNRDQGKEEEAKIQEAHLAHLSKMAEDRKICIVGPSDGNPDILGIAIYSTKSLEIADSLANADPAVKAGRLVVEVFPFWAAAGGHLF